ncbi:unnamed protein product [Urochloa humidicola]
MGVGRYATCNSRRHVHLIGPGHFRVDPNKTTLRASGAHQPILDSTRAARYHHETVGVGEGSEYRFGILLLAPAPAPAMREEGKVAGSDRAPRRRSPRLMRKEELSACCTSEQDLILKLKEEAKALRELQKEGWAREGLLDEYMVGLQQAAAKYPMKRRRTVTQPAGKTKRKKVIQARVPREHMDYIILNNRRSPYEGICDDLQVGKRSQWFREKYAERMAIANKHFEYMDALIKQFRTKGYADNYAEVTDDDEEN